MSSVLEISLGFIRNELTGQLVNKSAIAVINSSYSQPVVEPASEQFRLAPTSENSMSAQGEHRLHGTNNAVYSIRISVACYIDYTYIICPIITLIGHI